MSSPDGLRLFVVYDHPRDFPDEFVAREFVSTAGAVLRAKQLHARASTLDDLRSMLPPGLLNIGRQPNDDPAIKEVWL